jgi:hydroxymethylpyrimidine/phosphomethylpyrimidine kinase
VDLPQTKTSPAVPLIVVVGGLDPGGGAGILRDVAAATARGAHGIAIGTAWTEQGPGIHQVEPRAPGALREALARAVAARPGAVKVGMAVGPETAGALLDGLGGYDGPVVVDPVLATSRGGALWDAEPRALLPLLRRATLVTPNGPEAAVLARRPVTTAAEAEAAGRALLDDGLVAVLVKGGHVDEGAAEIEDVLVTPAGVSRWRRRRLPGPSPRGTGCALGTAIGVALARGRDLPAAVAEAASWLAGAMADASVVGSERQLR